jgi:hypothetical protein
MLHRIPISSSVVCSELLLGFWLDTGVGVENPNTQPVTPRPPRSTTTVSGLIRRTHVRIHVGTQVGTHIGESSDTSEPRLVKGKP